MAELDDYAWLTADEAAPWLERIANDGRPELQQLAALRRDLPSERARLVVEQTALRRRGAEKFGEHARAKFFTRQHLVQATDLWIGRDKARRRAASGPAADY
ncbi:MAG TPA: hypothetical protein VEQ85_09650, partial [Lacipirellulaceae bacterium]|nr:hypothetical protein [Lacipirellulaceae bacterium]